jgi:phosphate transport system protein
MVLEERLIDLRKTLIEFATLVEHMIESSINGLVTRNKELLDSVAQTGEPKANELDIKLDELCATLIAQYQPMAKDLRIILMIFKMNEVLERMADHAVNISESGLCLLETPFVKPLIDIPEMAAVAVKMLQDSISAFINEDADLAKTVCARDSIIDNLRDKTFKELIEVMSADSSTIKRCLHLMRISRNLERIADLSTNMCEDIIFIVEGKIIKHHHIDGQDEIKQEKS